MPGLLKRKRSQDDLPSKSAFSGGFFCSPHGGPLVASAGFAMSPMARDATSPPSPAATTTCSSTISSSSPPSRTTKRVRDERPSDPDVRLGMAGPRCAAAGRAHAQNFPFSLAGGRPAEQQQQQRVFSKLVYGALQEPSRQQRTSSHHHAPQEEQQKSAQTIWPAPAYAPSPMAAHEMNWRNISSCSNLAGNRMPGLSDDPTMMPITKEAAASA